MVKFSPPRIFGSNRSGVDRSNALIPSDLQNSPIWREWIEKSNEANSYYADAWPKFNMRNQNYDDMVQLRHGLIPANIPPSHREIVRHMGTKKAGEILVRLVAIMTAAYPEWTYHADGLSHTADLRASTLSAFWRSFWLGVEDRTGIPVIRMGVDQQLGVGGGILKIIDRVDRWAHMPLQMPEESDRDYRFRLKQWKARNLPFDVLVPEYNTVYYDLTTDGLVRVCEKKKSSVHEIAAVFGGHYDSAAKRLHIPVTWTEFEETEDGLVEVERESTITFSATKEVEYTEYWSQHDPENGSGWVCYQINGMPVRVDHFDGGIPYFLALGELTSSPDPGRMGLPILYYAMEDFLRLNDLTAMEDAFLYKHGFARLVHRIPQDAQGAVEPELPDQEEEEETIGEVLETKGEEDWKYLVPANVSALFADAKNDALQGINDAAMADILTGRMPPSGTTGFLMSQLMSAAVSKYVPLLQQMARALRSATLYMQDKIDREYESEVVVFVQGTESGESPFLSYKPGFSRGNHNLDINIEAPLPSDEIAKAQFLVAGMERGLISREKVQREGYNVRQPGLEDEKINLDKFRQFYAPIAMLRSMQRAGQMQQVLEAARMGLLPGALEQIALMFAAGPEGLTPNTENPNGVIQAAPGLGEPGQPTTGATVNAVVAGGGRASGAARRPGGSRSPAEPVLPEGSS